ncbi:MAG: xanthine dehydrogenase family protein molybdopterin-binding subunit [Alphaproteobacteria bacterium]|nr:xanthine dehydrogenase family protein molybdopterin-binding subunit [Alphaproteobacteria bacterium]MDX5370658.1 xanthine dehydrogenase family protein molybdopterin-binding subunit [Alphaproteobacteria bacterium]MDX5465095.1 xanthine dehydrogenase family protein molybdopterin-binding subunit [Alphaproteobacteria bacterium]
MGADGLGQRVLRKEDRRFITGKGRYTDDIAVARATHAVFVRSPYAHARIRNIDASEALAMPGVHAVLTGKDFAEDKLGSLICGWMIHSKDGSPMKVGAHPSIAADTVKHVGDQVAVVIADTREQARDAAEKVAVDYEELPAVIDPVKAMDPGAPQIHPEAPNNHIFTWPIGDEAATDAAFKGAAHVVKIDVINNRLIPNAIEPRAALAVYDEAEESYTLYNTTQNPHVARLVLSAFVGVAPEHKLRVVGPDVGGGFGSKIYVYPEETVCLWASKKVGRPVRWTAERTESFLTDAHARDHVTHAEMAFDADHRIIGFKVNTIANIGAYMQIFSSATPTYLYGTLLSGQYDMKNIYCEVTAVYTNTNCVDAYRGAGRPEATYLLERLIEKAAREMGVDRVELRRKNFIKSFPHQTPVIMNYDSGDFDALIEKALELADYKGLPARKEEAKKRGKLRGLGFSTYIEACGLAPSAAVGALGGGVGQWESAEVRVNPTGNVEVLTGSHSHGQGHETVFAQLIADRLGIGVENVQIVHGDTDKVQFGMGTYGSRSGPVGLNAILKALEKVEAKAKKIAAHLMEAAEDDIVIEGGKLKVAGTDKELGFGEVSLAAYTAHNLPQGIEPGLKEGAFYDPINFTFPSGCHVCEVEVDPDTGHTEIVKFTAVDDFGNIMNPMIVEGQVHGGLTQGIGQAMFEGCIYDKETGQLLTGSYMDYCMPRAADVPSYTLGHSTTVCPSNPLGLKGCGEAGAIGSPPSVINAIIDATGSDNIAMPATPERVWRAIHG